MGGGGSFSAGGPGKGMYTHLYQDVLTRHHWVYWAMAQNHAYSDSGIFCLFGSCHPSRVRGQPCVCMQREVEVARVREGERLVVLMLLCLLDIMCIFLLYRLRS